MKHFSAVVHLSVPGSFVASGDNDQAGRPRSQHGYRVASDCKTLLDVERCATKPSPPGNDHEMPRSLRGNAFHYAYEAEYAPSTCRLLPLMLHCDRWAETGRQTVRALPDCNNATGKRVAIRRPGRMARRRRGDQAIGDRRARHRQ
jgi:hypothetical protein